MGENFQSCDISVLLSHWPPEILEEQKIVLLAPRTRIKTGNSGCWLPFPGEAQRMFTGKIPFCPLTCRAFRLEIGPPEQKSQGDRANTDNRQNRSGISQVTKHPCTSLKKEKKTAGEGVWRNSVNTDCISVPLPSSVSLFSSPTLS